MDISQLGPVFIANNLIQRLDLDKNLYHLIIIYIIYNYFPTQLVVSEIKECWNWFFPDPPVRDHVSVTFKVREQREGEVSIRSDRYLAIMDYIKNLPALKHSEAIAQEKESGEKDVSIYEVCQDNEFLIDEEKMIYGN